MDICNISNFVYNVFRYMLKNAYKNMLEQHVISCLCTLKYTEHLDAYKLFLEIYENVAICAAYALKRLETM